MPKSSHDSAVNVGVDNLRRGHLFDRSVEGDTRVLRCRYGDCGHIWWPDEDAPTKDCTA